MPFMISFICKCSAFLVRKTCNCLESVGFARHQSSPAEQVGMLG